jgi:threonine dehydrogenase-like Zn-dependent dehydrogenase
MSAAVLRRPQDLCLEQIPNFKPAPDQVIVEVASCGICGSDLRYYHGENPWALHTLGMPIPNPPNIVLGHEFAGTVTDAADFPHLAGKHVAVMSFKTCGQCRQCRSGAENLCGQTMHLGHGAGWGERDYYPGGMAGGTHRQRDHAGFARDGRKQGLRDRHIRRRPRYRQAMWRDACH